MKYLFIFIALTVVLAGCSSLGVGSSDYGCPGMPQGVVCKTPRQVYSMTQGNRVADPATERQPGKALAATAANDSWLMPPQTGPLPVLEPAQVLRIWIAPWRDEKKDLIWPSYAFTEVTPRRWSFGGKDFKASKPLSPIRLQESAPAPAPVSSAAPRS